MRLAFTGDMVSVPMAELLALVDALAFCRWKHGPGIWFWRAYGCGRKRDVPVVSNEVRIKLWPQCKSTVDGFGANGLLGM